MRINISSNTCNGYTAENQEERQFFQRGSIPILLLRSVKNRKFKLLYFRNETCYRNGNLYKGFFSSTYRARGAVFLSVGAGDHLFSELGRGWGGANVAVLSV